VGAPWETKMLGRSAMAPAYALRARSNRRARGTAPPARRRIL